MSHYTPEDLEAWYEANPWDRDYPEDVVTGTLGFHTHVLDRRTKELGGAIRAEFEGLMAKASAARDKALKRYFRS